VITYRRPELIEAEAFAALHVQCWREAYAGIIPLLLLESFSPQQRIPNWQRALVNPERIVIGAYGGEQPVGFIMAGKPDDVLHDNADGQIFALYIAASHYRFGVGRKLLKSAAKIWLQKGGRALSLGVLAENVRARSFYESMGGKLVRTGLYEWSGFKLADAIYIFENLDQLIP
jgi:ribosomal protein S18 acetylase RimI-like enzyme